MLDTTVTAEATIGVEWISPEIVNWLEGLGVILLDVRRHFVVRRRNGRLLQVFLAPGTPDQLRERARACAQTWSATYVEASS